MHDAGGVDRGEPLGHLARDVPAELLRDPPQLPPELAERLALDVIHHQVTDGAAFDGVVPRPERRHDVGVGDGPPDLRLAEEPPEEAGADQQVRVDHLQRPPARRRALPDLLLREMDGAHAAGAETADQAVGPQPLRGPRRPLRRGAEHRVEQLHRPELLPELVREVGIRVEPDLRVGRLAPVERLLPLRHDPGDPLLVLHAGPIVDRAGAVCQPEATVRRGGRARRRGRAPGRSRGPRARARSGRSGAGARRSSCRRRGSRGSGARAARRARG